jgi:hypothetical protein
VFVSRTISDTLSGSREPIDSCSLCWKISIADASIALLKTSRIGPGIVLRRAAVQ